MEQRTSCEHRICLSIILVVTLICMLHCFSHSCCLTLKVFLGCRSFRTMSAGVSSVLESCSDLVESIRRSALRLELDFETFWLHFKGWICCTSLPHIVNTVTGHNMSHNMPVGPWAVFRAWLPSWWSTCGMIPKDLLLRMGTEKVWAQRQIWEGKVYSEDWLERDGCGILA